MANPIVKFDTSSGVIRIELWEKEAPLTVKNFLGYVESGFFDGTIFHRIIPGFVVQGGGHLPGMKEKDTEPPIKNEANKKLSNLRGTISMARTGEVDSATSQFFLNLKDNLMLDHRDETAQGFGYCAFGKIIEGLDVIDKMAACKTGISGFHRDVPLEDIVLTKAVKE